MKIILVGSRREPADEAMAIVIRKMDRALRDRGHDVAVLSPRELPAQFGQFRRSVPDVIHYLSGPTAAGLLALTGYRALLRRTRFVASLIHPTLGAAGMHLLQRSRWCKLAASSLSWQARAQSLGLDATFIPHGGVDSLRFQPVPRDQRQSLRESLGLPRDAYIVLHVGHLKRSRNLDGLAQLARSGNATVVIIGSQSQRSDPAVVTELENAGCSVRIGFFPNVENYYQAADCYAFPVLSDHGAIQLPLSVLEAIACGLPVVTTRFGGLPDLFDGVNSVQFFDGSEAELVDRIRFVQTTGGSGDRALVSDYTWDALAESFLKLYRTGS